MDTALQFILGIGIIQSIILGVALYLKKGNKKMEAQHIAVLLFLLAILIFSEIIELFNVEDHFTALIGISMFLDLLIAPLMWNFSINIRLYKTQKRTWRPIIIVPFLLGLSSFYLIDNLFSDLGQNASGIPHLVAGTVFIKGIAIAIFIFLTIREINRNSETSVQRQRTLLNLIFWPFVIIAAVTYIGFWLSYMVGFTPIDSDYLGCMLGTLFVYYLTYIVLKNPDLLKDNPPKYSKSSLPATVTSELLTTLTAHLKTNKPYLREEISLREMARDLNHSPNVLSQVINQGLGKNFKDLINEYRLAEVKRKLTDPSEDHKTILSLAYESGFSSKASFHRIFKRNEGITPSQYKEKNMSHPTL